ncbi:hypothetical protein [Psychrobacter pygoscelis]|uniref:hypothetical protein n=1 Tax=Psychrobacter pygoscelis TaxID=2488563 RepID=UPI0010393200|nr:hypothetical protein [Psychrobacter pygoscelis]
MIKTKNRILIVVSSLLIISICLLADYITHSQLSSLRPKTMDIKVYSPERGIVATMTSLGYPPYAISDKKLYSRSVTKPELPENIIDLGSKVPPNNEAMSQIKLDFILDTDFYTYNRDLYSPDIPLRTIDFGQNVDNIGKLPKWSKYVEALRTIGRNINKEEKANIYIETSYNRIIEAGKNVQKYLGKNRKIIVINLRDTREIEVVTLNNPIALTAKMMGLELISVGKAKQYGYASVPIHTLYELPDNVCLIIKEPIVEMTKRDIVNSIIWQQSPFFRPEACIYKIEPVWTRGGMQSMLTFAENLEDAVTIGNINELSYEYVTQVEGKK